MKVLQAAPVECIEDVPSFSRPLKPGVHGIGVLQLKEEVGRRSRDPLSFRQVTEFGILANKRLVNKSHRDDKTFYPGTCIPLPSEVSLQQNSLRTESSV